MYCCGELNCILQNNDRPTLYHDGQELIELMLLIPYGTKSWQRRWDSDSKARYTIHSTYELIPEVGTRICWPRKRDIGVSYCRMLLRDTMLNDDAFRTGVVTPLCSCNVEKETVTHFLFDCTNYSEAKSQLSDTVNDIWMSVSSRGFA